MKQFLICSLLFLGTMVHAQDWTTLPHNPDQPMLEENPLKGFANLFASSNDFPTSIAGKIFHLDDVMIDLHTFDWTVIDNFITQEVANGNHVYFQVNADPTDGTTGVPGYLIDSIDWYYHEEYNANGDTTLRDSCPDWNNPYLMEAMLTFVDSFGNKYDDDDRVFTIYAGLYGLWGEWQIGSIENIRPEFEMTVANKYLLSDAIRDAFNETHILGRYPDDKTDPQSWGYSDGLFFEQSITDFPWESYFFYPLLESRGAHMNWKNYPIGGEISPALQPIIWQNLPNVVGQNAFDCIDSIHPTWLFSYHIFNDLPPNSTEWDNALTIHKALGYNLHVNEYKLTAENGRPSIEVKIQNTGVAPFYANWDVEFAIETSTGFQSLGTTKWDLNLIQPGGEDNYRSFCSDSIIGNGTFNFLMRIANPLGNANAHPLRFANFNQDDAIDGWLTLGEGTLTGGDLGTVPTKVSALNLFPTSLNLIVGESDQLTAQVFPGIASNSDITWSSSHPLTAAVDANGAVSAPSRIGTAIITATTQDGGYMKQCTVHVEPLRDTLPKLIEAENFIDMSGVIVQGQAPNQSLGFLDDGDWTEYAIHVPAHANFVMDAFVSSLPGGGELVIVDQNGVALDTMSIDSTGGWQSWVEIHSDTFELSPGSYEIQILMQKGGFDLDWMEFRQFDIPVSSVQVTPTNATITTGETLQLQASVSPSNSTNQDVVWSSSDPTIVTVSSDGLVSTGSVLGTATITATAASGVSAQSSIVVQGALADYGMFLEVEKGDVYIEDVSHGVIMKSPSGECWRFQPDNNGTLNGTSVPCPNFN